MTNYQIVKAYWQRASKVSPKLRIARIVSSERTAIMSGRVAK